MTRGHTNPYSLPGVTFQRLRLTLTVCFSTCVNVYRVIKFVFSALWVCGGCVCV